MNVIKCFKNYIHKMFANSKYLDCTKFQVKDKKLQKLNDQVCSSFKFNSKYFCFNKVKTLNKFYTYFNSSNNPFFLTICFKDVIY